MPTNINWTTLSAAIAGLFAWLFPNLTRQVREDILIVAFAGLVGLNAFFHNFMNHPGEAQAWVKRTFGLGK